MFILNHINILVYYIIMPKNKFEVISTKGAKKETLIILREILGDQEEDQRGAKVGKAYGTGCFSINIIRRCIRKEGEK